MAHLINLLSLSLSTHGSHKDCNTKTVHRRVEGWTTRLDLAFCHGMQHSPRPRNWPHVYLQWQMKTFNAVRGYRISLKWTRFVSYCACALIYNPFYVIMLTIFIPFGGCIIYTWAPVHTPLKRPCVLHIILADHFADV